MPNLLTFEPKTKPEETAKEYANSFVDYLNEDVSFSNTPDLPVLRYAKIIPVFIWDELKTYKGLAEAANITHDMHETDQYLVHSKQKYLPFINAADKPGSHHDMLLPSSPEWTKGFKVNPMKNIPTRHLAGRIIHVNLEAIQSLDRYYYNTSFHVRHKALFCRPQGAQEELSAWLYTVPTRNITKYLPHENTYEMLRGFRPKQCSSNMGGPYTSTHQRPT